MPWKDTPQEIVENFHRHLDASSFVMIGLRADGHNEPMTARVDDTQRHALFFFSAPDNRIGAGGEATAQFVSKEHDFFASLSGAISEETDRAVFDRLWDKHAEAWFPDGKAGARLNRFTVRSAELWETDVTLSGRLKMLTGATISASEASSHAIVDDIR